jgi:predicted dehydrogenase
MNAIIVGAGLMGRWHADAARKSGVEVVAIVDRDGRAANNLASRHPRARSYPTLDAAIDRAHGDVVHLCTPVATHGELARAAIAARKHVLVEKPLTDTLDETQQLVELARTHGVLVCPVHQFLFQRGILRAVKWLGGLGALRHIDFATCSAGADRRPGERDRIAIDILPHPFALVRRLAPEPFQRMSWHVVRTGPGELRICGQVQELTASILISMNGRPPINVIRAIADGGTVHADLFHGFATLESPTASGLRKLVRPFTRSGRHALAATLNLGIRAARREPAYPGLRELVRRFYAAAASGSLSPIDVDETLAVAGARQQVVDVLTEREI